MASPRSLYDILNVSNDAEGVVIEAAYRALMKKYHPDQALGGGADGNSSAAEINQAFAVLRDPKRRAGYDLHERKEWSRNQPVLLAQPAFQPPPPRRSGFAWTGWLVALLLGAILYAVLNGRGGLVVPPPPGNESAAVEFDHRSQPVAIAPALDDSTGPTALDRESLLSEAKDAAARRGRIEAEVADSVAPADVAMEPPPVDLEPVASLQQPRVRSSHLRARSAPIRRNKRTRPRTREEEDFLRREGYIY